MLMEKDTIAAPRSVPTPLEFLQAVYANEGLPLSARLKAAVEAAQYVHPKLAVTATVNAGDFADQLEKAIERSRKVSAQPMMIEAKPMVEGNVSSESNTQRPHVQVSNGGKPFVPDRRFRRW
jgi:hypothetical protein